MKTNKSTNEVRSGSQLFVAVLSLTAWVSEATFMLSKAMSIDRVVISGVDVTQEIYAGAMQRAVVVAIGLFLGGLALTKRWRLFATLSALLYLAIWFLSGTTRSLSLIDAFALKWATAHAFGTYTSFALRDVILPVCFLTAIGVALFSRSGRSVSGTHSD